MGDIGFCKKPKRGFYCTWAKGHLGECDEWPEWWMELWIDLKHLFSKGT
jgi:hypothetical protein